jgi:hypothetical protein
MVRPNRRPWSAEDLALAQLLREQKLTYSEIGKRIGRVPGAVRDKLIAAAEQNWRLEHGTPPAPGSPVRTIDIPPEVQHERDRALAAPRDLTAILLGDPLPGRSALDRRMGKEVQP